MLLAILNNTISRTVNEVWQRFTTGKDTSLKPLQGNHFKSNFFIFGILLVQNGNLGIPLFGLTHSFQMQSITNTLSIKFFIPLNCYFSQQKYL
jgi:hypothetical protein